MRVSGKREDARTAILSRFLCVKREDARSAILSRGIFQAACSPLRATEVADHTALPSPLTPSTRATLNILKAGCWCVHSVLLRRINRFNDNDMLNHPLSSRPYRLCQATTCTLYNMPLCEATSLLLYNVPSTSSLNFSVSLHSIAASLSQS